jgi:hypothetical protein
MSRPVDRSRQQLLEKLGLPPEQLRRLTPSLIQQLSRCKTSEAQRMLARLKHG